VSTSCCTTVAFVLPLLTHLLVAVRSPSVCGLLLSKTRSRTRWADKNAVSSVEESVLIAVSIVDEGGRKRVKSGRR
jgi:hypothetical protein